MTWIVHGAAIPAETGWIAGDWIPGAILAALGVGAALVLAALAWRDRTRVATPAGTESVPTELEADTPTVARAA